jgi:23S rRNA (cytidine1920-2'-O)/16S rRNA (cytidine1409-2'-O)-methyltransferase
MADRAAAITLRADEALVARGLAPSRNRAQALIAAGTVFRDGQRVTKPAQPVAPDAALTVADQGPVWASRAGDKLAHALAHFAIAVDGALALDLGASTGGFTDVLLTQGAARIVAVDVGHGQLLPRLAADPRVTLFEGLDARAVGVDHVPGPVDLLVADLAFISLTKALRPAMALVRPGGDLVALVKPQFEVGPAGIGKGGIVKDEALRQAAVEAVKEHVAATPGWRVLGTVASPIAGGDGNKEFLLHARKNG